MPRTTTDLDGPKEPPPLRWISQPMGARIDLSDKDALNAILDDDDRRKLFGSVRGATRHD